MKRILTVLLFLYPFFSIAQQQGQALIDSLLRELPRAKEDTNKVKVLTNLSYEYSSVNPDDGLEYGRQALDLAAKLGWKKGIASANNRLGINYQHKSDYTKALAYFSLALKISKETGDENGIAAVTCNIGNIYSFQGDYPKALEFFFKALQMDEKLNNKNYTAIVSGNIGNVYEYQGDMTGAMEYFLKALKISEETGNKRNIAKFTGNIGEAYCTEGMYPKAMEYLTKALNLDNEIGNRFDAENIGMNIGNIYCAMKDTAKSLEYYLSALKIAGEIGDKDGAAFVSGNIGNCYAALGNYSVALKYDFEALKADVEIDNKNNQAWILGQIGIVYFNMSQDTGPNDTAILGSNLPSDSIPAGKTAQLHNAIAYLQRSLYISINLHLLKQMQEVYETLADAYKINGDYKQAMDYYEHYTAIKDSLYSTENKVKIAKAAAGHELELKEKQIQIVELALAKKRDERWFFITGIFLLTTIGILFINQQRLRQKKLEAEKKNTESELVIAAQLLDNFRQSIQEKNSIIEQVTGELALSRKGEVQQIDDEMLLKLESSIILTDQQWEDFRVLFEKVHKGFFKRLKEKMPDLTPAEIRFVALSKLKLTPKEMASMLGISSNSIRNYRLRLRRKLGLNEDASIEELTDAI